jgi:hypothetical protein
MSNEYIKIIFYFLKKIIKKNILNLKFKPKISGFFFEKIIFFNTFQISNVVEHLGSNLSK